MSGIAIDTRKDCAGKLYVAIEGENNDGHDFLKEAFEAGFTVEEVAALTKIDPWFLSNVKEIADYGEELRALVT